MSIIAEREKEYINVSTKKVGSRTRKAELWLGQTTSRSTGNKQWGRVFLSGDVADKAAWKVGDKVMFGKFKGTNIFFLEPSRSPDALIVYKNGNSGQSVRVGNSNLAHVIHSLTKCDVFEAWADDCTVYFKVKQKE